MASQNALEHPYRDRTVVLATQHQKEQSLGPPLWEALHLRVYVPPGLDTDALGTFTGEVAREGSPKAVALRKARQAMAIAEEQLGLASEGSFGPHPAWPLGAADHELVAFVDAERNLEIVEQWVSFETNFSYQTVRPGEDLQPFLRQVQFPSHGLIVRPHQGLMPGLLWKGVVTLPVLQDAIARAAEASDDGLAQVETDMRAHMNPTRRRVLSELGRRLAARLSHLCPACQTPGWGVVETRRGLPCEWCGSPTELVWEEISGCPLCDHQQVKPRSDGRRAASASECGWCNP